MKIGIITQYFGSYNYGGVLQAYALAKTLNHMGHDVKQIAFNKRGLKHSTIRKIYYHLKNDTISEMLEMVYCRWNLKSNKALLSKHFSEIEIRKQKFDDFRNAIPHTAEYNPQNIEQLNSNFDAFITGSDQVWNPEIWCDEYFLNFAKGKRKIAYAASMGVKELSLKKQKKFAKSLQNLDFISVREDNAIKLVRQYSKLQAELVLDPTLLLTADEWSKIEKAVPDILSPFILCYFLGKDLNQFTLCQKIGKQLKMPIVFIPFASLNNCIELEENFGDTQIYCAGPREFIWLIHNANYIVTDSFHGAVFSIIFRKNFWLLNRCELNKKNVMMERIYTLLSMFNINDRLLIDIESLNSKRLKEQIDYVFVEKLLNKRKKESEHFLRKAITH